MKIKLHSLITLGFISCSLLLTTHTFSQVTLDWVKQLGQKDTVVLDVINSKDGYQKLTAVALSQDSQGNSYIAGSYAGTVDFDPSATVYNLTSNTPDPVYKTTNMGINRDFYFQHAYIAKVGPTGNLIWVKTFGGKDNVVGITSVTAVDIEIDKNNDIYFVGNFQGEVDFDPSSTTLPVPNINDKAFALKLDNSGNLIWAKTFGNSPYDDEGGVVLTSCAVDTLQNLYMTGNAHSQVAEPWGGVDMNPDLVLEDKLILTGTSYGHAFISKLDKNGGFVWAKNPTVTPDFAGESYGVSIDVDTTTNDVVLTGHYQTELFSQNSVVSFDFDFGPEVHTVPSYYNTTNSGGIVNGTFVLRVDENANFKWVNTIGIAKDIFTENLPSKIITDNQGNVYVSGHAAKSLGSPVNFKLPINDKPEMLFTSRHAPFLVKFNKNGTFQWAKNLARPTDNGDNDNIAGNIAIDKCGNIYCDGIFSYGATDGQTDFDPSDAEFFMSMNPPSAPTYIANYQNAQRFITKLDSTGAFQWARKTYETNINHLYSLDFDFRVYSNPNSSDLLVDKNSNLFSLGIFHNRLKTTYSYDTTASDFDPTEAGTLNLTPEGYTDIFFSKMNVTDCCSTPVKADAGLDVSICAGQKVLLTGTGGTTYLWDKVASTDTMTVFPTDTVTYELTAQIGDCKDIDSVTVAVAPYPVVSISPENPTITQGAEVTLTATTTVEGIYSWAPSLNLTCGDCLTPTANPSQPTEYCITVTPATSPCKTTQCIKINVDIQCGELFVPTGFSPNGDKINDVLEVKINPDCVSEYEFLIFDRWGEKVFEGTSVSDTWDGKFNDKKLDNAVFVYYLKVKLKDSTNSIVKKGNVSIIK